MNIENFTRAAWDREVEGGNPFTIPVSTETMAAARQGQWEIYLTDTRAVKP